MVLGYVEETLDGTPGLSAASPSTTHLPCHCRYRFPRSVPRRIGGERREKEATRHGTAPHSQSALISEPQGGKEGGEGWMPKALNWGRQRGPRGSEALTVSVLSSKYSRASSQEHLSSWHSRSRFPGVSNSRSQWLARGIRLWPTRKLSASGGSRKMSRTKDIRVKSREALGWRTKKIKRGGARLGNPQV